MSMPGRTRGSHLPYKTLAGAIPFPGGWLVASAKLQGITMAPETPQSFPSILDVLDYKPAFQIIALFSPVGLLDNPGPGGRQCDRDARKLLGWPRSSAIMSAPARPAVKQTNYRDAVAANGGHLDAVSWTLLKRAAEVDAEMAPFWQRTVFEVHPELSYFQLNDDKPVRFSKHQQRGLAERREILESRFAGVSRILEHRVPRATQAHMLDVAACLWTARRIISRAVERLPQNPEWDSAGLRMEIVR